MVPVAISDVFEKHFLLDYDVGTCVDMPYQPFSKSDRLGKVSDWTGSTYQDRRHANKYQSQFAGGEHNMIFAIRFRI